MAIQIDGTSISQCFTNIIICFMSLEYLILRGIRRILTYEKPKYSLSDFINNDISISKVLFS